MGGKRKRGAGRFKWREKSGERNRPRGFSGLGAIRFRRTRERGEAEAGESGNDSPSFLVRGRDRGLGWPRKPGAWGFGDDGGSTPPGGVGPRPAEPMGRGEERGRGESPGPKGGKVGKRTFFGFLFKFSFFLFNFF